MDVIRKLLARFSNPVGVLLACLVGAVISVAAWGPERWPVVAIMLPIAIAICQTRGQATALAFAYIAAINWQLALPLSLYGDVGLAMSILVLAVASMLGACAWSLGWSSSPHPWRKAMACVVGWTITLVLPTALVAPGHPLIGAAFALPRGMAWGVVLVSCIGTAMFVYAVFAEKSKHRFYWLIPVVVFSLVKSFASFEAADDFYVNAVKAKNTNWGGGANAVSFERRIGPLQASIEKDIAAGGVDAFVLPENSMGIWGPEKYDVLSSNVLSPAANAGVTVVLGTRIPERVGVRNAAVAFYPNGTSQTAVSRIPLPVYEWAPWRVDGVVAEVSASNILPIREGLKARVYFGFEELIPLLRLVDEYEGGHQMTLAMADHWSIENFATSQVLSRHGEGLARMFGKPRILAMNVTRSVDSAIRAKN